MRGSDLVTSGFTGSPEIVNANNEINNMQFRDARNELQDTLAKAAFEGGKTLSDQRVQELQALSGVGAPEYPSNIPGLEQLQQGTFAPKMTAQDFINMSELFGFKIPATQQGNLIQLINGILGSQSGFATPSAISQIMTAISGTAGKIAGAKAGSAGGSATGGTT